MDTTHLILSMQKFKQMLSFIFYGNLESLDFCSIEGVSFQDQQLVSSMAGMKRKATVRLQPDRAESGGSTFDL